MAWPTGSELKGRFKKLEPQDEGRLQWGLDRAVQEVKNVMSSHFAISGWDTTTPPALADLVYDLAYAYITSGVHTGSSLSPSDEAGKTALDRAKAQLYPYLRGGVPLLSSSGTALTRYAFSEGATP
jgi:hypothetical protein